jgi:amino acid transporter
MKKDLCMASSSEKPTMFLRKASGLVRAWSPFDMFAHEVMILSPVIAVGLTVVTASNLFPAGDQVWGTIILLAITLFGAVPYALLGASMPRTGGDYVWQSRILSPGHAFTFTVPWTWWMGSCAWVPFVGWALSWLILSPTLYVIGGLTGNAMFAEWGAWISTTEGTILSGIIVSVWCLIVNLLGMRIFAYVQKACLFIGTAGWLTWVVSSLAFTNTNFISSFNSFTNTYLGVSGDVYHQIINLASNAGYNPTPAYSLTQTFMTVPILCFVFIWVGWVTYSFGEVRKADTIRNQLFMLLGGTIFAAVVVATTIYGLMNGAVGREFYQSAIQTYFAGTSPLPIPPFFAVFISSLHVATPAIMLWILFSLNAWWVGWVPTLTLEATRCMFATSFDRLLPAWIAEVKTRFHVPVNAILLSFATNVIFVLIFDYVPAFNGFWLNVVVWGMYVQMTTVFAAVIWPWRRKAMFETSSAAKYKWLIVITGTIYIIFSIVILALFIWPPTGALYGTASIPSYLWLIGLAVAHYAVYRYYVYKRRKEGVPLQFAFKEIPVE